MSARDDILRGAPAVSATRYRRWPPPGTAAPRHYHSLDLLRGFAALIVCIYHVSFLFTDQLKLFGSGFLCVDLFFILSGFVIAANYDRKIAEGLTLRLFVGDRLARLYPLFLLTMLIGLFAISVQQYSKMGWTGAERPLLTLLANALMIPSFFSPWGSVSVFPLNGPSWSIFFEMWINVLFFLAWRQLDERRLWVVVVIGGMALVVSAFANATVDVGWGQHNFGHGFVRVVFSFFFGVAIFRSGIAERLRFGPWPTYLALAMLLIVLHARSLLPDSWGAVSDLVIVLGIFPLVVAILAASHLPRPAIRLATVFGGISYSVYLLQTPLVIMASGIPPILFGQKVAEYAPYAGFFFIPFLLGLSYLTWRFFELPAKNRLRRLQRERAALSTSA